MNLQKYVAHERKRAERFAFPDTCTVETVAGAPVMAADGTLSRTPALRAYRGSTAIPCRIQNSRSFRPDRLPNQEINVNEYVLSTPVEVVILPNDKIRIGGRVFEARKQTVLSELRLWNEALIVELEGQY